MKKKIGIFFTALFCFLILTGCMDKKGNDITDKSDTDQEQDVDTKDKISTIEEKAKNDVEKASEITEDEIKKAVDYIDEHINDPFKDETVTEKLAYYGAYLKEAGAKTTEGASHELSKMGANVHTYVKNIYTKTESEMSKISTDLKTKIEAGLKSINEKKDTIINDFHKAIHNTKADNTINE